nr:immunoglobulin light chain junction region [Macaca mulatta]MOV77637.1 immunoglobulin light chain junction region [Macaca mulatta]MOV78457.1 immunoglobulin light chain junction region [Macaca mulatta]MOV78517.1 immunoglobulin light chain junction region [Macaca mulatta]MOV78526.1 immunoglobulin light chain junction region [Macaca mulatta]
CQQGNSIPFTF